MFLFYFCFCASSFCANANYSALNVADICVDDYCFPKVVWSYWDGERLSPDVDEMINVTKESLAIANISFCFLSWKNVSDFLDVRAFPGYFYRLYRQNKADFIRISLLKEYGGVWIDASTYINKGSEVEWYIMEGVKNKAGFVAFKTTYRHYEVNFGFLGAPRNSEFMKAFRAEYAYSLQVGYNYTRITWKELKDKGLRLNRVRTNVYMMIDLIYAKLVHFNATLRALSLLLPSERSPLRFLEECGYDSTWAKDRLLYDPAIRTYPWVKVWHGVRIRRPINFKDKLEGKVYVYPRPNEKYYLPKTVWAYWDSDIAPDDVQQMIDTTRTQIQGANYTYILLSDSNLTEYMNIAGFPEDYFRTPPLPAAVKAEYISVCLLERYGGMWIDAPTFINNGRDLDWIYRDAYKHQAQLVGFGTRVELPFSQGLFGSPNGSNIIRALKEEYDVALTNMSGYVDKVCESPYMVTTYKGKNCTEDVGNSLLTHVFRKVKNNNRNVIDSWMHLFHKNWGNLRLQSECRNRKECVQHRLQNEEEYVRFPFMKLGKEYRDGKRIMIGKKKEEVIVGGNKTESKTVKENKSVNNVQNIQESQENKNKNKAQCRNDGNSDQCKREENKDGANSEGGNRKESGKIMSESKEVGNAEKEKEGEKGENRNENKDEDKSESKKVNKKRSLNEAQVEDL